MNKYLRVLATITVPIWILPFLAACLLAGIYDMFEALADEVYLVLTGNYDA